MVALFGLDTVIPYKPKVGASCPSCVRRTSGCWTTWRPPAARCMGLPGNGRWAQLRAVAAGATRKSELGRIEDEVDAILCAYLAWMWVHERASLTVWGDVRGGLHRHAVPSAPGRHPAPHLIGAGPSASSAVTASTTAAALQASGAGPDGDPSESTFSGRLPTWWWGLQPVQPVLRHLRPPGAAAV